MTLTNARSAEFIRKYHRFYLVQELVRPYLFSLAIIYSISNLGCGSVDRSSVKVVDRPRVETPKPWPRSPVEPCPSVIQSDSNCIIEITQADITNHLLIDSCFVSVYGIQLGMDRGTVRAILKSTKELKYRVFIEHDVNDYRFYVYNDKVANGRDLFCLNWMGNGEKLTEIILFSRFKDMTIGATKHLFSDDVPSWNSDIGMYLGEKKHELIESGGSSSFFYFPKRRISINHLVSRHSNMFLTLSFANRTPVSPKEKASVIPCSVDSLLAGCLSGNSKKVMELISTGVTLAGCNEAARRLIEILYSQATDPLIHSIDGSIVESNNSARTNEIVLKKFTLLLAAGTDQNAFRISGFKRARNESVPGSTLLMRNVSGNRGKIVSAEVGGITALEFARENGLVEFANALIEASRSKGENDD